MTLKDAILKVKVLDRTELDERLMRSTVKLENDLTVAIPNSLIHFEKKVAIPQIIADWIEYFKNRGGTLYGSTNPFTCYGQAIIKDFEGDHEEVLRWIRDNSDTYARAWLDSYTIEEEKRYYVRFKFIEDSYSYLTLIKHLNAWMLSSIKLDKKFRTEHTRKQLEDAEFGWVFNCPGIEVEEVEE
ncbi:DUF1642 domain-containing protein [Streptococcus sp. HMSC065C01]|uniref:DUF1642 domain-containing protein n=1 Tax=Streptococcus sp. HMSC065C01 TaxID=1739422 RepID=UPI0008C843D4|nr:DUF1642 domain-containing protein [Streptococcus sp. HMSC065C01]OFQ79723.1 hypothetical protein HMPREF2918_06490 [Streptococcus sp. HMSC065C01]